MMVLILERVPPGLRGELTRWLLEPQAGVFVGRVSALVRDLLWDKVCRESRGGGCLLIHTANQEQGFALRIWGEPRRRVEDFEGLFLIRVPQ
ncbi:MAG: type I-E CRISPR-associated endoribonuclease Cas2 [Deltaproteobacteria bacterium]|nr:type I-E CRISPR-associated endoribonuclease Cas2 [Deltaproteobacteria bacterium]